MGAVGKGWSCESCAMENSGNEEACEGCHGLRKGDEATFWMMEVVGGDRTQGG